jgi:hypothetical protein
MPATTGMKCAGYYDQHSTTQLAAIHALEDWIALAVENLALPSSEQPITILDLGSSEGHNAIRLMQAVVEGLRRRTSQALQTIYNDLDTNDFNRLLANLAQLRRAGLCSAGVYPGVVAGSFYEPLLPPCTVHLATCFNAIHWLDRLPTVPVPDCVAYRRPNPPRPGYPVSPEITAAFRRRSEQDLVRFLMRRARELVSGGKLLLAGPGDTDHACIADGILDILNDACLDLVDAGQMKREQYECVTMPCYFRTVEEMVAPLDEDSPACGAFTADRAEALEVPTPFIIEFQRTGDEEAYANAYTGFLRAVSEPIVKAALRHSREEKAIVEALYERVHARLQAEPEHYLFRYILVAVLLTRC